MTVDLRDVIEQPGEQTRFSCSFDLSDMEFPFGRPFINAVVASGVISNTAGLLTMDAELKMQLSLTCDRCTRQYEDDMVLPLSFVLAEQVEQDDDEIVIIDGDRIDLEEVLIPALVLSMDMKHLCSEECKGLCAQCGHDLNTGPCCCPSQTADPRLAGLQAFFTDQGD